VTGVRGAMATGPAVTARAATGHAVIGPAVIGPAAIADLEARGPMVARRAPTIAVRVPIAAPVRIARPPPVPSARPASRSPRSPSPSGCAPVECMSGPCLMGSRWSTARSLNDCCRAAWPQYVRPSKSRTPR
jgi:hypothetical protein